MKLYFIPSSVPELAALPRKERDLVWLHAKRSALKKEKSIWLCIFLTGVSAGIGAHLGSIYGHPIVGAPIGGFIAWTLLQPVFIHAAIPYVREALRNR